jgi:hypothetical protein
MRVILGPLGLAAALSLVLVGCNRDPGPTAGNPGTGNAREVASPAAPGKNSDDSGTPAGSGLQGGMGASGSGGAQVPGGSKNRTTAGSVGNR